MRWWGAGRLSVISDELGLDETTTEESASISPKCQLDESAMREAFYAVSKKRSQAL